ncbi:hypothetical protein M0813_07128 [Anaeramoeba flamelloides]|uniref:BTB domain-containing protein n=1 Tax=Anaeramoeba flamelloides TaxID=1746091 RepID=A0ABQ8XC71_9EUKA|nr:hypothetical protein M0813_07128 [Anaeramoeba flamelloides]
MEIDPPKHQNLNCQNNTQNEKKDHKRSKISTNRGSSINYEFLPNAIFMHNIPYTANYYDIESLLDSYVEIKELILLLDRFNRFKGSAKIILTNEEESKKILNFSENFPTTKLLFLIYQLILIKKIYSKVLKIIIKKAYMKENHNEKNSSSEKNKKSSHPIEILEKKILKLEKEIDKLKIIIKEKNKNEILNTIPEDKNNNVFNQNNQTSKKNEILTKDIKNIIEQKNSQGIIELGIGEENTNNREKNEMIKNNKNKNKNNNNNNNNNNKPSLSDFYKSIGQTVTKQKPIVRSFSFIDDNLKIEKEFENINWQSNNLKELEIELDKFRINQLENSPSWKVQKYLKIIQINNTINKQQRYLKWKGSTSILKLRNYTNYLNRYSYVMNKNKSKYCEICKKINNLDIIEDLDHFLWNCSAYENNRELGLGHKKNALKPTQIKLEFPVEDISKIRLGLQLTSILTNDGKLYVTGNTLITGFGSDLTEFKQYPQFKNNNTIIKEIGSGYNLFTILTQDNEIWVQGKFNSLDNEDSFVIRKIQTGTNLTNDLSSYNQIKCCDRNLIFLFESNSYLSQDLEKLLKNGYISDCNIQNIPVHKILIETRIGKTFDLIKKYLESNCKLNEIQDLLKWIYCDQMINFKRTNEILNHFGIQNAQKTKLLKNDLKQLLFDEQTSDFKLVVKNEEDEEEEEEELYIHKFILAARSGLFLNMFENLDQNLQKVKDYSEKSLETIELLISFLYTDELAITADTDQEFIKEEFEDIVEYYQLNPRIPMMDIFEKSSKK